MRTNNSLFANPFFDNYFDAFLRPLNPSQQREFKDVETQTTDDSFLVRFFVPGVSQEELELSMNGNRIVLTTVSTAAYRYHYERTVSPKLDLERASADLADGILEISIPFVEEQKPRTIRINAG